LRDLQQTDLAAIARAEMAAIAQAIGTAELRMIEA
jgi:hypothetical protein